RCRSSATRAAPLPGPVRATARRSSPPAMPSARRPGVGHPPARERSTVAAPPLAPANNVGGAFAVSSGRQEPCMPRTDSSLPRFFLRLALAILVVLVVAYGPAAQAPAKKAMSVDDYTKWKSITDPAISGDGKWVTYVLQTTNVATEQTKPMLHVLN